MKLQTHKPLSVFREILEGLQRERKTLPAKLFYDEKGSKLFDRICELEEYYPTKTEIAIMENNIDSIAGYFEENSLFIEFGSGSSMKTRLLLDHIKNLAGYVPVDISEEHLNNTVEQLEKEYPQLEIHPLAADFTKPFQLPPVTHRVDHKIIWFPGSTIGNFTKKAAKNFLIHLGNICGTSGGLLIGVDMVKDKKVLEAAYNDKEGVTAEFNLNLLDRLNREFGFNFQKEAFFHKAVYNEAEQRIEMLIISKKEQSVQSGEHNFSFEKGEAILTEYSHKYTPQSFAQLAEPVFHVEKIWTDEKEYFSIQFLSIV